jgi:hypothetical protein
MSSVYVSLDAYGVVVNAVSADSEEEAAELCSYGVRWIKHDNSTPFLPGWTWNGSNFSPPAGG